MMTRPQALDIFDTGAEKVVQVLCEQSELVDALLLRVSELEEQKAKNSRNSSKPPSSDGAAKPSPKSLRPRGQRKPGGQKGHAGHTLGMTEHPDHTVAHRVDECEKCHCDLKDAPVFGVEKRQVFDIPVPVMESTEHQAEIKVCPHCEHENKAAFPAGITATVQYGERVRGYAIYLREYHLLPSERTCELMADLFGCGLSEGTLANIIESVDEVLEKPVEQIAEQITAAAVAHFDETGCSVKGKRQWLHVACTHKLTYYRVHQKRGTEAMDAIGILPKFQGRAVHDHWKPYFTYKCEHGLCNAHHLRELTFVHEQCGQAWAKQMIDCLVDIKKAVDEAREHTDHLEAEQLREFEARYQQVLDRAYDENPLEEKSTEPSGAKKPRRQKKSKPRNLLERLDGYRNQTLAFMYDFRVPFDDNQGERDIRMTKVQQKISGTFRSESGAAAFCRIRSYISTAKKNAVKILDALFDAFKGKPFIPNPEPSCVQS